MSERIEEGLPEDWNETTNKLSQRNENSLMRKHRVLNLNDDDEGSRFDDSLQKLISQINPSSQGQKTQSIPMIINNSGDDNNSTFSNKLQTNRIEKAGLKNMPPDSNPLYRRRLKPIYEASDISPSESKSIINIVPVSLEKGYEGGSRRKVNINELRMQGRVPGIAAQPENEKYGTPRPTEVHQLAKPYELVEVQDIKILLNSDLLEEVLLKYEGNIKIVSVQGLPNKGKSNFLNRFLDNQHSNKRVISSQQIFSQVFIYYYSIKFYERNPDELGGTEGAIIWGQPLYNPNSNTHTFLIDVEGIDKENEANLRLQLLILLLSDVVIFFSDSELKDIISTELDYLLEIENKLNFPILDSQIYNYMPEFVLISKEKQYQSCDPPFIDDLKDVDKDSLLFEHDLILEQYLHSFTDATSPKLLKIKKILKQTFKSKKCFFQKVYSSSSYNEDDDDDGDDGDDTGKSSPQKQFYSAPDKESSMKILQSSENNIHFMGRREILQSGAFPLSQSSKKGPLPFGSSQKAGHFKKMQKGLNQNSAVISSNPKQRFNRILVEALPSITDVDYFRRIINIPSTFKRFNGIEINSFTFCKYASFLAEEINEGTLIDPKIMAAKAVVSELQRVLKDTLKDHLEKIHAFVSYEQFESMQKVMSSLISIRSSSINQLNRNVGRFLKDSNYNELLESHTRRLKSIINNRETQVFDLLKSLSFGINEENFRLLKVAQLEPVEKKMDTNLGLKEYQNEFIDQIQQFQKDFLSHQSDIDAISKVHIYNSLCSEELSSQLRNFVFTFEKKHLQMKIDVLEQDSNKRLYEKLLARFEIIKQKSKILEDMTKAIEMEAENLKDLEKVIHDRFIKSYNQQNTFRQNSEMLQKLIENDQLIKNLQKTKQRYSGKTGDSKLANQNTFNTNKSKTFSAQEININGTANIVPETIPPKQLNIISQIKQQSPTYSRSGSISQFNSLINIFRRAFNHFAFYAF